MFTVSDKLNFRLVGIVLFEIVCEPVYRILWFFFGKLSERVIECLSRGYQYFSVQYQNKFQNLIIWNPNRSNILLEIFAGRIAGRNRFGDHLWKEKTDLTIC